MRYTNVHSLGFFLSFKNIQWLWKKITVKLLAEKVKVLHHIHSMMTGVYVRVLTYKFG